MRIKLTLNLAADRRNGSVLPLRYQKNLLAGIGALLREVEKEWDSANNIITTIHRRRLKLLTFSHLMLPFGGWRIEEDRIKLLSNQLGLVLNIYTKLPEEKVAKLFENQMLRIYDASSRAAFWVSKVQLLNEAVEDETMEFKTLSPLVMSRKDDDFDDVVVSPTDSTFEKSVVNNLLEKYAEAYKNIPNDWLNYPYKLEVVPDTVKPRKIYIKTENPSQSLISGYDCKFKLHAPKELLKFGLQSGFGKKNAMGFGCVEAIQ